MTEDDLIGAMLDIARDAENAVGSGEASEQLNALSSRIRAVLNDWAKMKTEVQDDGSGYAHLVGSAAKLRCDLLRDTASAAAEKGMLTLKLGRMVGEMRKVVAIIDKIREHGNSAEEMTVFMELLRGMLCDMVAGSGLEGV